jgi:poly-gamma-glutamate capsule biosynthesis protein CapA/YwtB (metallophosphatase superfamily)
MAKFPHPSSSYPWGEALQELDWISPNARIINLETGITSREHDWRDRGIHYRKHPKNVQCLRVARPDVVVLANNHILDFGYSGLAETLATLAGEGMSTAGADHGLDEAQQPARVDARAFLVEEVRGLL